MKGFSGESRFYFGDELRQHLRDLVDGSTKIDIATAWVSDSDVSKLLISQAQQNAMIRIVAGVGQYFTAPVALKRLGSTRGVDLKVYGGVEPPLFHPKLYIFQRQHWHRALIGSMNLTHAGTTKNLESVLSFEDKQRTAEQEFDRFWKSPSAIPFDQFDLNSYEERRRSMLSKVKDVDATPLVDEDVLASANHLVQSDPLREGWKEYVEELKSIPDENMQGYRKVLADRGQFVNRDWSQELSATDLDIMYGTKPYRSFGGLRQAKINQGQFKGTGNVHLRRIGDALGRAVALKGFERFQVLKVVEDLLSIPHCGDALATRLLVLARPDMFVIYNDKSFAGLKERFGVSGQETAFTADVYVDLLEKIHTEKWFRSSEPEDSFEQELWAARTALLDALVYKET